jgi:hypothetical protein
MMLLYIFIAIGPVYRLDYKRLFTKNLGLDERPLDYYANEQVRAQRYKKWRALMWLTMIIWVIIFPSLGFLRIINPKYQNQLIFYGEWIGILYPKSNKNIYFWNHVSGYLIILGFLVIEK